MFRRLFLTRNVAIWDRILRTAPALAAIWAYTQGLLSGPLAIIFVVISAILLVTAITGTCSIYGALGISTLKSTKQG